MQTMCSFLHALCYHPYFWWPADQREKYTITVNTKVQQNLWAAVHWSTTYSLRSRNDRLRSRLYTASSLFYITRVNRKHLQMGKTEQSCGRKGIMTCSTYQLWTKTHILISWVPDQNGVSQAWYIVEIHHSGPEPSICSQRWKESSSQITQYNIMGSFNFIRPLILSKQKCAFIILTIPQM